MTDDTMEFRLEVIVVPVSDVDRSKLFYTDLAGFNLDVDRDVGNGMRVVQMTPPGSACSVTIGPGGGEPGTLKGLQLTVGDIHAARDLLAGRGLDITEVQVFEEGRSRAARDGDDLDYAGFAFFDDPDENSWAIQQMPNRKGQ